MECLNALVTDALDLVPDVIDFLNKIKNPEIFAFCAIPQVCFVLCVVCGLCGVCSV